MNDSPFKPNQEVMIYKTELGCVCEPCKTMPVRKGYTWVYNSAKGYASLYANHNISLIPVVKQKHELRFVRYRKPHIWKGENGFWNVSVTHAKGKNFEEAKTFARVLNIPIRVAKQKESLI